MKVLILVFMILLPGIISAAENCKTVEYQNSVELICNGDAKQVPSSAAEAVPPVKPATVVEPNAAPVADPVARPVTAAEKQEIRARRAASTLEKIKAQQQNLLPAQ